MSRFVSVLLLSACLMSATAPSAWAQYDNDNGGGEVSNAARMDVRIAQLEEQIRRMEGAIEQISYQNKQLKAQLDKANADMQYRLQALESHQGSAPAAPAPAPAANNASSPDAGGDTMQPVQPEGGEASSETPPSAPVASAPVQQFASSRDHYNHAFRLMQQAQYAEAGSSFVSFTHRYPHDPLIGNAFYWLGETYYVRKDYTQAADNFRQGYEAMPQGPKAADNLLKLAMSLDALKKDREACVVLKQVVTKYGSGATTIKQRAEQEINRIGCN